MMRNLSLVKSDIEHFEKRIIPRFPFCYLTFKADSFSHAFEVRDISITGMQLILRLKNLKINVGDKLKGEIHWQGRSLAMTASVQWVTEQKLGVEFILDSNNDLLDFLDMSHCVSHLKSLHLMKESLDLPSQLKTWLRADGPVELLVWTHADGVYSKFQILYLQHYIEWKDGEGLKTGRIISKRNIDTPLIEEDELVFKMDDSLSQDRLNIAQEFLSQLNTQHLMSDEKHFLIRQLSH